MNTTPTPIIVEEIFDAPVQKVWTAITVLDEMKRWYFDNIPTFEPVVGFETEFGVQSETRHFQHIWKITEVIFNKKISYSWQYSEYTGAALVSFELFEMGNQTKLRVSNFGLETFPQDIPEFAPESCQAGWEYFIKGRLKKYLA